MIRRACGDLGPALSLTLALIAGITVISYQGGTVHISWHPGLASFLPLYEYIRRLYI